MSEQITLAAVTEMVAQLPLPEQRQLAETILQRLSSQEEASPPARRRAWREIRGIVSFPYFGEDAQEWVTRTRREADESRERGRSGQ